MTLLTCDFDAGTVRAWHATGDGVDVRTTDDYRPSLYVAGPDAALTALRETLAADPKVAEAARERMYLDLRRDERADVLRVHVGRTDEVRTLAHEIKDVHERGAYAPGTYRLYNVDFAPGFRYCVETGTPPVPERDLRRLELSLPEAALADGTVDELAVDGESVRGDAGEVLETVHERVRERDPDVLLCNDARLLPLCFRTAMELGDGDFQLGRAPGWTKLAGRNTYESYGQVGHSPARFSVPGRAIVDRSNSFLLDESGLPGLLDLVERSWRPLQETAWASIGTVLTAIQVRHALARDVLVPWNKWEGEAFKRVETLHGADRGGVTFAPDVGLHEDVVEVDFASLYPSIMCEYNISPETVRCPCHDRADVPGLEYSICDRPGFLPDVLQPIVDDRAAIKAELDRCDDPERSAELQARADALKWILVSCFGYQGYRNAKFGRIECHEAINAFAREILLDAKERLENAGWRVVHGIVDSLWIQPVEGENRPPLADTLAAISEGAGIDVELENRFDWVCFVPRRDGDAGTLTKYFGTVADADEYKRRGIEARQRSTPPYVASVQRECIDVLDETRSPEAVCDRLQRALLDLRAGAVDPAKLLIRKRVSKALADYTQATHTVAALQRARELGLERSPGQSVRYVVVDDDRRSSERVRLAMESPDTYDAAFYETLLVRACESVVAPLGWDRRDVERYLRDSREVSLGTFER